MIHVRRSQFWLSFALLWMSVAATAQPDPDDWESVLEEARGQTVYWNAWAGEPRMNDYIAWAAREARVRFGVEVVHVKLSDTAEAVSRVLAEKAGGRDRNGAVDLIWINGENFLAMKQEGLLFGPWAESLPNFPLTDPDNNPAVREDFTVPVEGYQAPWGKSQVVFYHDTQRLPDPPRSMSELLNWARENPGRFTYPRGDHFLGTTFLKQALLDLVGFDERFYAPVDGVNAKEVTRPLWTFLDTLHPHLWRQGRVFPANGSALRRMMGDGEIDLALSFNINEASTAVLNYELPPTVDSYVMDTGTIGNVHFLAIPYNASNKAGAMVLANFLLSPGAQLRKQDPEGVGGSTVLAMDQLSPGMREQFRELTSGLATPTPDELGAPIPEPHPDWALVLEREWLERYGVQ